MKVSVILCTYNRSESLTRALGSICEITMPEGLQWEVLVVDNNSRDDTRAVVDEFCSRHPGRIRYLFQRRQGKSFALNQALQEARGDILAFVDDDVTVEPDWLRNLTEPLLHGEWAGAGGRILPAPGFVPPRWLALGGPRSLGVALCAMFDLGASPGQLSDAPFGTNMAYRREVFEKYGPFRGDLGPSPAETRHEDTELGRRLMAAGERLYYVPTAIVYHEIRPDRVRKQYFLRWWFDRGRGAAREAGRSETARQVLRGSARTVRMTLGWLLSLDPERRFYRKCMLWDTAGKVSEIFRSTGAGKSALESGERLERAQPKRN